MKSVWQFLPNFIIITYTYIHWIHITVGQPKLTFSYWEQDCIFSLELHLLTGNSIISSASVVRLTESNDLEWKLKASQQLPPKGRRKCCYFMSRLYQSHTKRDLIKEQDSFSIPFCTLNFNRYPPKYFPPLKYCCVVLCLRIWTACIYSLWSHVNIHSSTVKMKSGQEGF